MSAEEKTTSGGAVRREIFRVSGKTIRFGSSFFLIIFFLCIIMFIIYLFIYQERKKKTETNNMGTN